MCELTFSLLSYYSKIFTTILMERLKKRTEEIISEEQAGFRHSSATIDQISTLEQLTEKYTNLTRDLHISYVDFRKAFDII